MGQVVKAWVDNGSPMSQGKELSLKACLCLGNFRKCCGPKTGRDVRRTGEMRMDRDGEQTSKSRGLNPEAVRRSLGGFSGDSSGCICMLGSSFWQEFGWALKGGKIGSSETTSQSPSLSKIV